MSFGAVSAEIIGIRLYLRVIGYAYGNLPVEIKIEEYVENE
ncbi:MAG: hypothetical protein ACU84Q_10115 [Gammaproteobacteria bacterium]